MRKGDWGREVRVNERTEGEGVSIEGREESGWRNGRQNERTEGKGG